jgi:antitoxin component YwqK of YwqJK toxin-antitoxin module
MKKLLILVVLLFSGVIFAQEVKPTLEAVGKMVKATYYYENGQVQQEGFYKNGKLHGKWISYDLNGNKKAIGEYNKGEKTGKWFFWNGDILSEVDYSQSRIASVSNWKKDALVIRN